MLVTPYVATEACYLVGKYVGAEAEINLVEALAAGDLNQIEVPVGDLIRMVELMRQYVGFPLGVADASVIAAANGSGPLRWPLTSATSVPLPQPMSRRLNCSPRRPAPPHALPIAEGD